MSDAHNWQWWASSDEERYQGPYDSREEAIQVATGDEMGWCEAEDESPACLNFYIVEAYHEPIQLSAYISVSDMVERWEDGAFEELSDPDGGDSILEHITQVQWDDLETMLRDATRAWQARNKIVVTSFAFAGQRNSEHVIVPIEDDSPSGADAPGHNEGEGNG